MSQDVFRQLCELFPVRRPDDLIMGIDSASGYRIVSHYLSEHGPVKFTHHQLRHTFCSIQADKNMPIKLLMEIMGHENLATTQLYFGQGSDLGHAWID